MHYLILALATWRISNLLVNEPGPWDIFVRLRALVGVRYDTETFERKADHGIAGAFNCIWCMSVWIGALWSVLFIWKRKTATRMALPFALSAGTIVVDELVN